MRAPSSPLTVDLGRLFRTRRGSSSEPLITRAAAGWQLGAPDFLHLRVSRVRSRAGPRISDQ
jgi:hypothetical protein